MRYYKIYHYSGALGPLSVVDPDYCGSGVDYKRWRKTSGINKSFFYVKNDPEQCMLERHCYEVYLPYEWKARIYDVSSDPLHLYKLASEYVQEECKRKYKREPYAAERDLKFQEMMRDLGYKGYTNSSPSTFTHVIALFCSLPVLKPKGEFVAFDWDDKVIEDHRRWVITYQHRLGLFSNSYLCSVVNNIREADANDVSDWMESRWLTGTSI